jgi:hypothetical protein
VALGGRAQERERKRRIAVLQGGGDRHDARMRLAVGDADKARNFKRLALGALSTVHQAAHTRSNLVVTLDEKRLLSRSPQGNNVRSVSHSDLMLAVHIVRR